MWLCRCIHTCKREDNNYWCGEWGCHKTSWWKGVTFKDCATFTKYISKINNPDIDNAKDNDIVMPLRNLIEDNDNYSKTSGSLSQYYKDDPNDNIADSESLKFKVKNNRKNSWWW